MNKVLRPLLSSALTVMTAFSAFSTMPAIAKNKAAKPAATSSTAAPAASAKDLSVKITNISSPIKGGADASVAVQTDAGATCNITVKYKSGPATAAGLKVQRADASGKATWTWKVAKNTAAGEWPVEVTASSKGAKGSASGTLKVEK